MLNVNIMVRFGTDEVHRSYPQGVTISQVLNDRELRVTLGYGDNVRALVAGVEQSPGAAVPDGATLVIETKANSKAE